MQVPSPEKKVKVDTLHLTSNPLKWSVNEVVKFLKTTDCANLARICKEQVSFSMSAYQLMYSYSENFQRTSVHWSYYNFVKLFWSYSWYALFAGKYFVILIHSTLSPGYVLRFEFY